MTRVIEIGNDIYAKKKCFALDVDDIVMALGN